MRRRSATAIVAHFEAWVRADEWRTARGDPDYAEAIHDGYRQSRERMIRHLMGTTREKD